MLCLIVATLITGVPLLRMLPVRSHAVLELLDGVWGVQGPLLGGPGALLRQALQHSCEVVRHVVRHHARGDEDALLHQILRM